MRLLQPFLRSTRRTASTLSQPRALLLAPGQQSLRNDYYALRHGWSKANEAGVIVSRIDSGARIEYGLHATGQEQASAAGEAFRDIVGERPVAILSSDFSRTFQTAKIVAAAVCADVEAEPALRERDFGAFELGPNTAYDQVWARDAVDATHTNISRRRDMLYGAQPRRSNTPLLHGSQNRRSQKHKTRLSLLHQQHTRTRP